MSRYSRLCRSLDYLAAQFNERTSLAEAAAHAGLSPFYFHRLFADAFHETPHQFMTLGSFSTGFHSLTGLSPVAFRREARRLFGTSGRNWPLYYMPACFQHFFGAGY
jgi:Bacterial regulatory helix-turn-helix proteins, AraC family